jgi:hypothetical protein
MDDNFIFLFGEFPNVDVTTATETVKTEKLALDHNISSIYKSCDTIVLRKA